MDVDDEDSYDYDDDDVHDDDDGVWLWPGELPFGKPAMPRW